MIGLTGGVATGKTTVAGMFKALGAKVLSADEIVHEMLQPGSNVWSAIVDEFGDGILGEDGRIDRRKLAETVFSDTEKRLRLEAITHPPVLEFLAAEAERFRNTGQGVLMLEIPLLVETASLGLVDKVLVVSAEQDTQIRRLQKRYSLTREEAKLRIRSQLPMSEKIKHADWVVSTEGALRSTREQVERVWSTIQESVAQGK
ncbi:MAG TPA: dephospho-CoA kinase [Armatimonadota bacterium]|nr:dephospho-CoA kinase [Armatimonadota bacterium]